MSCPRPSLAVLLLLALAASPAAATPPEAARPAWFAWKRGDVPRAAELARALDVRADGGHLQALVAYVQGQYTRCLALREQIAPDYRERDAIDRLALEALIHLDWMGEARALAARLELPAHTLAALDARRARPLRVRLARTTTLACARHYLARAMPAFPMTINGQRVVAHMDTGGDFLHMSPARARRLGIATRPAGTGLHAVSKTKLATGLADRVRLGEAALDNVPVTSISTLQGPQDLVIFGTGLLRRFLVTFDYPRQRMLLSPRGDARARAAHLARLSPHRIEMPFYLWGDHYLWARGALGKRQALNFFVDSGLVYFWGGGQVGFWATRDLLASAGVPEKALAEPVLTLEQPLSLGLLERRDGLISHAFWSHRAWTLDFARRRFVFSR